MTYKKAVSRTDYDALLRSARAWETLARKNLAKNIQLHNANKTLQEENTLYILNSLKNGSVIYKKV